MSKYHLIGHCEIVLTLMGWLLEDDVNFNLILISEIGNVWPGANSSNLFGRFWRRNWWRKWRWKEENCKNFLRQYFIFYILYFKILLILYVVKKANPNEWKVKPKISLNVDWFSIFHAWIVLEQFLLQVSFLKVLKQEGFPEKLFPLYEGNLLYLA